MTHTYKYIICALTAALMASCSGRPSYNNTVASDHLPEILPDYAYTTIPSQIAPMDFDFVETAYHWLILSIKGSKGGEITCEGRSLDIDIDQWHSLAEQNKGGELIFSLSAILNGTRTDYKPFPMFVSHNDLEQYGLTYRLVEPGYSGFAKMGLYERNLSNYDERSFFETTECTNSCVNCHTPNRTNSSQATFHVRGQNGFTFLKNGQETHAYNMKTDKTISGGVYPYWHPEGRYIAYSNNNTVQVFHAAHKNRIEVFDNASDIAIFDTEKEEFVISPQIKVDSLSETFPAFSPDGNTLYYCVAPKLKPSDYLEDMHYCLMKAAFDTNTGKITGKPDTLLAIPGKSLTLPRPSYDGKYLMFTVCDYGTFPIWHHESDLYMLDLESKDSLRYFPARELNSNDTESFHNWSANSKWVVFSSRRDDGLYTRLYMAEVQDSGRFSKPFLLPQRNPSDYYRNLMFSYNTPDFCDKPLDVSPAGLRAIANDPSMRENVGVRQ
ncbi:MAG: hypothetical protein MJZ66_07855 [Bacteroidales bacterium]|nr:hypothetical protein [Bacteroidales bacterium]